MNQQRTGQNRGSGSGNSSGGGGGRRRRGGKSRGRRTGQGPAQNQAQNPNAAPRTNSTPQEKIVERYDALLELHNQARRKYYEMFHRAEPQQRQKLERAFDRTVSDLRHYEHTLNAEQKAILRSKRDGLRPDLTYATNHNLPPEEAPVSHQGNFEDPHELQSQREADFSKDTEESMGTLDDYMKYKGLD